MSNKTREYIEDFLDQATEDQIRDLYDWSGIDLTEAYFEEPGCNYDDTDKMEEFAWETFLNDPAQYLTEAQILKFMEVIAQE